MFLQALQFVMAEADLPRGFDVCSCKPRCVEGWRFGGCVVVAAVDDATADRNTVPLSFLTAVEA